MRRALVLVLGLACAACGQPEDVLSLDGRVQGVDGGDPEGVELVVYRDDGATELGCTRFSEWQHLRAGAGGNFHLDYLRQDTNGRAGLNRCLRVQWRDGERTANLSWLGRARDTLLPDLLTWFDAPGAIPSLPIDMGGVLPQAPSYEIRDARGVVFRQALTAPDPALLLAGPGPAPARDAFITGRFTQRGQRAQTDALGQDPLLEFEYRLEAPLLSHFDGNLALEEVGHGSACNLTGADGFCALTDGRYDLVPTTTEPALGLELTLPSRPVRTVVLRGFGTTKAFNRVVLEGDEGGGYVPGARLELGPRFEVLATGTFEDERPALYLVLHWTGPAGPLTRLRVRFEDGFGVTVPIEWAAEISLY